MTGTISTRPDTVRCTSCYAQKSRLSYTPLHCMRLPYWMFGWVFHESFKRYPQVLTSAEIHRRLDISYKSALKLKRRFQLFCSQQQEAMKVLFKEELAENHYELPPSRKADLSPILKGKTPPVNIDTLAIFSASQRVNKGRKRNKHGGLTASIYMNDSLGGRQVGSLFQTIAVQNGPVFMHSVPNQKMETLLPILQDYIPPRAPVFSDAGYKWYYNPNHRMVNHSAKSEDKRFRFAKDRWSKNWVHCQTAEGMQSAFKTAMRNYRYFRPEHSQLYANEFSFLKNAAYFGLYRIASGRKASGFSGSARGPLCGDTTDSISTRNVPFMRFIKPFLYSPPDMEARKSSGNDDFQLNKRLLQSPRFQQKQFTRLRTEMAAYDRFSQGNRQDWRFRKEAEYQQIARLLWEAIGQASDWVQINDTIFQADLPRKKSLRIVQLWTALGIIELVDRTGHQGLNRSRYSVRRRLESLPNLLYIQNEERRNGIKRLFRQKSQRPRTQYKRKRRFE